MTSIVNNNNNNNNKNQKKKKTKEKDIPKIEKHVYFQLFDRTESLSISIYGNVVGSSIKATQ